MACHDAAGNLMVAQRGLRRYRSSPNLSPETPQKSRFMSDPAIAQKVKDIVVEQLGVNAEQVTPEADFIKDLNADSLDMVELVMACEEAFGVEVPDEDAEKLKTVGSVVDYIQGKQGTAKA